MTCYQSTNLPSGFTTTGRPSYATEADCLQACREGACCEGTTCTVKPQCQCQGAGKTFKGVGTVCTPGMCTLICSQTCGAPESVRLRITVGAAFNNGESNPSNPALPSWVQSCISSTPQILSGEYILRFSGVGNFQAQPQSAIYRYTTTSSEISFYWNCDVSFTPRGFPFSGSPFVAQDTPPTNGFLLISRLDKDCTAAANGLSQGYGMAGPLISNTCQGQALQMYNWTLGTTRGNTSIGVRFQKDGAQFGGLSGFSFECDLQVSQA